jgi:hypothetical protein
MTTGTAERPVESTEADVTLVARGITVQATVALSNALALVVQPTAPTYAREVGARIGEPVELFWSTGFEERKLPAQISGVDDGAAVRWNLMVTGEAAKSTRRRAVRVDVEVPVRLRVNNTEVQGTTVDLSEAGMRALIDGYGLPPEPGVAAAVDVELDGGDPVRVTGTVVRQDERAGRWLLSMRFDGVPEREGDRLRRRVFQALREERARLAD